MLRMGPCIELQKVGVMAVFRHRTAGSVLMHKIFERLSAYGLHKLFNFFSGSGDVTVDVDSVG
jgi:N-acetylglutamate synthase-like GNAT family acetyltransferase